LGINLNDLYHQDFKRFKSENPKIFAMPQEIQKMRWEYFNRKKTDLIQEIKTVIK
jgi:hypothetical protein